MKPFKEYKKLVESVEYKGWKIELDDIAKYPGEFSIEYKYNAYKETPKGRVNAPFRGKICINEDMFDARCQMTKKELIEELKKIEDNDTSSH